MSEQRFVARRCQLAELHSHLYQALASQGRVAFVMGEAGSGKTALVTEFAREAELVHGSLVVAIGNCNAQTGLGDPYLPFREILVQVTGGFEGKLERGAISAENARRLGKLARWSYEALMEFGPDLVGLLVPGSAFLAKAGKFVVKQTGYPEKFQKFLEEKAAGSEGMALDQSRIFEQYTAVLIALAQKQPLVLVLDDLQWADNASTSLLFHLGRRVAESCILVLGAYRPEEVKLGRDGERHPLEKVLTECKRYFGNVWVDLDQAEVDEARPFVDALVDLEPNHLGETFRQALAHHTGGHPLFAVELLRSMQEQGSLRKDAEDHWVEGPGLDWATLPPRVEGVIEERIGRLETDLHDTLTVGSVEGEKFTAEVVAKVRSVDERSLVHSLSNALDRQHRLVMSQGARRLGSQLLSAYRFRHSLFQKYLYEDLDAAQKTYLHEDVGSALETLYGEHTVELAPQLARHFQEAGLTEKAVHYLRVASEQAMRLSANEEAIGHLHSALSLLETLPPSEQRNQTELALQMGLATATIVSGGFAAPGVRAALDRARTLCSGQSDAPQLFPIVRSLYTHYHALGEHQAAYDLAQQLSTLGREIGDPALLIITHQALGQSQGEMGDPVTARETLEHGLAYHDPERYRTLAYVYGEEHGVSSRLNLAINLTVLGYLDQALSQASQMLALAEGLGHPHVQAYSRYGMSTLYLMRREYTAAQALAEKTLAFCKQKGIPFWQAATSISLGYLLAVQGRASEGIAHASGGLAMYRTIGAGVLQTVYLGMLAEMHLLAGQLEAGLALLEEGLAAADSMEEHLWEAEMYRLRARFWQAHGAVERAEADLYHALEVARSLKARFWELRALNSLARLRLEQGRGGEVRQELAEIVSWFTEGFDTADVQEAHRLLEEIRENAD